MFFWQIENQKGARARSARAPFWVAAEGRHLYLPKSVPFGSLFAKKCQKSVWKMSGGHFFDIFWTFFQRQPQHQDTFQTLFGHFSGRLPGSPKRHFGTLFGHFSGRLPGSPKRHFGIFFGHFLAICHFDSF